MQFITLLLTIAFVFHLELSDCAPLVQTGGTRLDATRNTTQPAEKHPRPYIGYEPKHARRGPQAPATRQRQQRQQQQQQQPVPGRPPLLPLAVAVARRAARPVTFPPTVPRVKQAQAVQNVYRPLQHAGLNPTRRPAPIPRPATFARDDMNMHPRAKAPIQRPPPAPPAHIGGYVHDIQKSSKWDPLYHAGVKGPRV